MPEYNFSGWATKNDLLCSDGRVIRHGAFKHHDGQRVPLVWNHDHSDPYRVVGYAELEHRDEGVYTYGYFNNTDLGQTAKEYVEHGDITQLSIYANQLKQQGNNVMHGCIREVSLVMAGANPGAFIENVIKHSDDSDELIVNMEEAHIFTGENIIVHHADEMETEVEETEISESETDDTNDEIEHSDGSSKEGGETKSMEEKEKTVQEVFDELTEEQKDVVYAIIGSALEEGDTEDENEVEHSEGGYETMKTNVFDNSTETNDVLMHADIMDNAIADAKRFGSLKESVIQHAAANNITNIADLLPADKDLNVPPTWIKDDDSWVAKVMGAVHHTPFSRVRALFGQMDETEARARGYIKKGEEKKDLKLAVLKRTTTPTTVYIKMKMDRDDIVDIASYDVISWIRSEMRNLLNKELAVGFLIGDGRDLSSDDKIDEQCIRPVLTDDDMYTIKYTVTDGTDYNSDFNSASENDSEAKGIVRAAIKSRKGYKGSGTPTFYTTEDTLTELLLIEDQNGRRIYESITALATAMRVKEIVTVPELESHTDVYGIIVNMNDYNTGADKGGEVNMFDDFDIDYNQQKYLMETRCSGALVRPKSAIVLKKSEVAAG